ncbi:hypothetical protein DUI87_03669 [Hirundo rustica rustica]|uniref:Uncharacterized protein n=1 Tax=Hirundo rustica rustica TaxID=333673 RepID=A0A3M0L0Z1_HIRRU|nr:hypothetical protein DUI87_03669 [Hirundo rustica rustica]
MENNPAEKDLGMLVEERLDMTGNVHSQPRKSNVSWSASKGMVSRVREQILPFYSTQPGVLHTPLCSSAQERHGPVGASLEKDLIRGIKNLSFKKKDWDNWGCLARKREGFGVITTIQYLKGAYKKDGENM